MTLREILVTILLVGGSFFFVVGTLGLLRMPDALCRIHATTKCDTLGGGLVLLALALRSSSVPIALRVLLILCFLWLTNPVGSHLIARAIYRTKDRGEHPG